MGKEATELVKLEESAVKEEIKDEEQENTSNEQLSTVQQEWKFNKKVEYSLI